jgi:tellurite resistance protein
MSKNSIVGGGCVRTRPLPSLPEKLPGKPLPEKLPGKPLPEKLPGKPLPDSFVTRGRSSQLANAQGNQLENIQKGIANGTISQKEAEQLLGQQARIADAVSNALSDGVITAEEQANIRRMQLMAGINIHQASSTRELSSLMRDPSTTRTQAAQVGQIAAGVRSGELTGKEASSLLNGQANIARNVREAMADGRVDASERRRISLQQGLASHNIRRESSDLEKAPHGRRFIKKPFITQKP